MTGAAMPEGAAGSHAGCVVVVPTFEEAENIGGLIEQVLTHLDGGSILVVDDASPDGTADIVRAIGSDRVRVHVRPAKAGLGSAYVEAFRILLARSDVDAVCTMDADFSHDPRYLPELLGSLATADVAIGSRYVDGGRIIGWEPWRRALSRVGNLYARAVASVPIHDLTSGFVAFRRSVLAELDLDAITSSGYAYTIESKCMAYRAGAKMVEVPITFVERRAGSSKLSRGIVGEGLLAPWRVRLAR